MEEIKQSTMPSDIEEKVSTFRRATDNMIATNDASYDSRYQRSRRDYVRKYTNEEIQRIISSGSLIQQSILSNNYFSLDGFYRRIIIYYATYLKYIGVLIPQMKEKPSKETIKSYNNAVNFINNINMNSLCVDFAIKGLLNGTYYGVVQNIGENSFATLDLPFNYCSTRYKDQQNNDVIEFNLAYFDSIVDKKQKKIALQVYPEPIVSAYKKWTKKKTIDNQYYIIPSDIGICFSFFDGRPMFLSTLLDIADYYDYKIYDKKRVQEEIRKILVQKVPHLSEGQLLFEPDEAEVMHKGTVGMMKNNENVSVLTTYADTEMYSSDASNESVNNILDKAANAIYKQAGVSPQLFSLTGNVATEASIQKDGALAMYMASKFANFFTSLVNKMYKTEEVSFKFEFLSVSNFNEKEYIENSFKLASSGYSLLLPAMAMGMTQSDLSNIKVLENSILKLDKLLKPLQSSYTQSGNNTSSNEPGAPAKKTSEKSERTLDNEKSKEGGSAE